MKLKTRVFDLYARNYKNLPELAKAMGISASQVYRIQQGSRPINEKFIIGAIKAFPTHKLNELFYIAPEGSQNDRKYQQ